MKKVVFNVQYDRNKFQRLAGSKLLPSPRFAVFDEFWGRLPDTHSTTYWDELV